MSLKLANVTFDCDDPLLVSGFWAQALGLVARDGASEFFVALDGGDTSPVWFFAKVPEGKTAKNRMHLDLQADDRAAEVDRLVILGARRVDDKSEWGVEWTVLADPEGNEFCVSGPHH